MSKNVKGRIKNVLNYKKSNFWIVVISAVILAAVCIGLLTNPVSNGVIMMNDILYRQSGKKLNALPSDVYEIGELDSILLNRNKLPERNFQGSLLDEKYAGNSLYENKVRNKIYLEDLSGYYIEFVGEHKPVITDKRFYIMTVENGGPIGCEYGTTREVGNIDTLEMLSMLEELQGFQFYEDDVSHLYIEFQFRDEKPKEVYLRYITEGEWQTEYPIDSATYKIKVPAKVGKYSFFADITWNNQEKETVFFDITIKENYDIKNSIVKEDSEQIKKNCNEQIEIESDIAAFITYNFENRSMYIVGLKIFDEFGAEEFGYINEGGVNIDTDENLLEFHIICSTGPFLATGTISGPNVRFKMNIDTGEIVESEFTPAPNYAEAYEQYPEYIKSESIKYSEKTVELSDERMAEIGKYFMNYILEIEAR